ncbi:MAG: C2H2-type zinc finger protein, partial [Endozoicomonadaceae bacterium]|nr:C2H2-type zinc finger protein [Endozoicomonadaceae bacterium]
MSDNKQSVKTTKNLSNKQTTQTDIKKEKNLHQCNACHKIFTHKNYLNRHNCEKTSGKAKKSLLVCAECNACFYKPSDLTRHQLTHKKEKPFQCKICRHAFKSDIYLKRHVATMHKKSLALHKELEHSPCGEHYTVSDIEQSAKTTKNVLNKQTTQIDKTEKKKLHQCSACHKTFHQKSYLDRHNCEQSSGETKKILFECEECNACFHKPSQLTMHKTMHTEEKPFECKICNHTFKRGNDFKKHVKKTHQNTCLSEVCSDVFESEEQLEEYKNSILYKKPFKCDICTNSFSSKVKLTKHQAEEHQQIGNKTLYECDVAGCHALYLHKNSLTTHKALKHLPCGGQVGEYKALKLHRKNCETCQNFKPTIQSEVTEIKRLPNDTISSATDIADNTQTEKNELVCAEKQSVQHHDQDVIFLQSTINNQVRDKHKIYNHIESLAVICPKIIIAIKDSLSIIESRINDKNCDVITNIIDSTTIKENIKKKKKLFLQFKFVDYH